MSDSQPPNTSPAEEALLILFAWIVGVCMLSSLLAWLKGG